MGSTFQRQRHSYKALTCLANRLRADQVSFEEFNADRSRYIFPQVKVASPVCPVGRIVMHCVPVTGPPGEIDVRMYHPTSSVTSGGGTEDGCTTLPLYINFHGGGFVLGGLDDDDSLCHQLCERVPCRVANVAYRLAPQFPHPVPATDSWAALRWLVDHAADLGVDESRIAIGGLSAGGCLAAALAQMAAAATAQEHHTATTGTTTNGTPRRRPMPPLVLQLLIVPVLDTRYVPLAVPQTEADLDALLAPQPYASYRTCAFAPMLPLQRLVWFYRFWLGADPATHARNAADLRASPAAVDDAALAALATAGLAPASIHSAEIDPLRSEAEVYTERLRRAGGRCALTVYRGTVHPFAQWDGQLAQGRELIADLVAALQGAFRVEGKCGLGQE